MIRIAVNGAKGRMGSRIVALGAVSSDPFEIAGAFDQDKPLLADSLKGKGVLIDFSGPAGTPGALLSAEKAGWGLVIGTTGLDRQTEETIRQASKKIPVVFSANMSVGVNLVAKILEMAASRLGGDFKISMTEAHHVHKKDAPSGTALLLKKAMAVSNQEIPIKSIREGEVIGDHSIFFTGPAETIEITHRAQSRDVFALGALKAATFAANKKNGLYNMADVLGLK